MAFVFNKICLLKCKINYFDRRIYFYESLDDYEDFAEAYEEKTDINFNPNDGVTTSIVVSLTAAANYFEYTYLLVLDASNNVVSRWYIINSKRNLSGQFTLDLRRDVIAESIASEDFITEAPIYVEKGILEENDPLIVNDEGISFNQIKKAEYLVRRRNERSKLLNPDLGEVEVNDFNNGWIIGYFNKGTSCTGSTPNRSANVQEYMTLTQLATAVGMAETDLKAMFTGSQYFSNGKYKLTYALYTGIFGNCTKVDQFVPNGFEEGIEKYNSNTSDVLAWTGALAGETTGVKTTLFISKFKELLESNRSSIKAAFQTVITADYPSEKLYTRNNYDLLRAYEGTIIYIGGEYKQLKIKSVSSQAHPELTIDKDETTLFDNIVNSAATYASLTEYNLWKIYLNYSVLEVSLELEDAESTGYYNFNIPAAVKQLKDAPYSMFAIPFSTFVLDGLPPDYIDVIEEVKGELALDVANSIATELDANLLDIQILPYCPDHDRFFKKVSGAGYNFDEINLTNLTENVDYSVITKGLVNNKAYGIILFPQSSRFSFTATTPKLEMKRESKKIESQTDFYRLCAPNWNGIFEFNLAKNGGSVSSFLVDCFYKPFNPFIKIAPTFDFLYGVNFNDARGLICGGDYSLSIVKDQWINYELLNKNYSMAFSRDITNLEFSQKQEKFKEPFTVAAGAIGAGAAGALAGGKMGGGYGAAAGAIVGTATGIVGGALDMQLSAKRRAEEKDYAIDRFNMNLGNIRALPRSLSKTSVLSQNFRIMPVVEYYTCTDEEVEALKKKIEFDGMTVGRIDYITNYMGGNANHKYFKGQLIRATGIFDNEDFIEALYNEIAKGVYI